MPGSAYFFSGTNIAFSSGVTVSDCELGGPALGEEGHLVGSGVGEYLVGDGPQTVLGEHLYG